MKASDIMTSKVFTIDSLATIMQATKVMEQHKVKTLIVDRASVEDAYGIITQTDIAKAIANAKDPAITYVCEVMTKPCIVVNPDLSIEHIIKLFVQARIRIAPVIKNKLLGIVSLTDIITKTDYLTPEKVKYIYTSRLSELPSDRWRDGEWEVADWEGELENWCSG
ncbi:CBS domain-containing protein [Waterburya agarophytonicola K14]|uniref:CBS domain-containing protein n=1 Tax=Waterburya agarophytonicola KI4 TaxID=2874699 RepID=A0A964BLM7_9CYAN|nr:CBS domain-containing protein [Waterburya agarophytonicola]MCC0175668.1 CBS domain-containing protein [Waterburya agarophytonicola KI4]